MVSVNYYATNNRPNTLIISKYNQSYATKHRAIEIRNRESISINFSGRQYRRFNGFRLGVLKLFRDKDIVDLFVFLEPEIYLLHLNLISYNMAISILGLTKWC